MSVTSTRIAISGTGWERLTRLRDALDLVAAIRGIRDPFNSAEDFRKLLSLIVQLAEQFGIDQAWLDRWESLLNDEQLVNVVLAIARYVLGILNHDESAVQTLGVDSPAVVISAQSYAEWLPFVIELLQMVLRLRGSV